MTFAGISPSLFLMITTRLIVRFLPLMLFAVSGCTTLSTRQMEQVPSRIRKGSSTKAEVVTALGKPDRRRIDPSGETWIYGNDGQRTSGEAMLGRAIGIGAGFIPVPYAGTAISGVRSLGQTANAEKPHVEIKFDRSGRVKDYVVDLP